jgi:death-on-curing family protein
MGIQISDRIVNIVHTYVVHKLIAVEGVMYSGTISGSLERIFNGFRGYQSYQNTLEKGGAILYSIVHGHSFSDGNKRTGLLTTYLFLLYNGYSIIVPKDTTQFLERMADAVDPNAPTEKDAIKWVKDNSRKSVMGSLISSVLTVYCRIWGTHLIETMTANLLEQNVWPVGLDKDKLTDKKLLKEKQTPAIQCSND